MGLSIIWYLEPKWLMVHIYIYIFYFYLFCSIYIYIYIWFSMKCDKIIPMPCSGHRTRRRVKTRSVVQSVITAPGRRYQAPFQEGRLQDQSPLPVEPQQRLPASSQLTQFLPTAVGTPVPCLVEVVDGIHETLHAPNMYLYHLVSDHDRPYGSVKQSQKVKTYPHTIAAMPTSSHARFPVRRRRFGGAANQTPE